MRSTIRRLARLGAFVLLAVIANCIVSKNVQAQTWGPIPGDFDATAMSVTQQQLTLDLSGAVSPIQVAEMTNYAYQIYNKVSGGLIETRPLQTFWCSSTTLPGCDQLPTDPQIQLDLLTGRWIATALSGDFKTVYVATTVTTAPEYLQSNGLPNWNFTSMPACSNGHLGDQPVFGIDPVNRNLAVDIRNCFPSADQVYVWDTTSALTYGFALGAPFTALQSLFPFSTPVTNRTPNVVPATQTYFVAPVLPSLGFANPIIKVYHLSYTGSSYVFVNDYSFTDKGVSGNVILPFGQQLGCTTSSQNWPNCAIQTGDLRIRTAVMEYNNPKSLYILAIVFATAVNSTTSANVSAIINLKTGNAVFANQPAPTGCVYDYPSTAIDYDYEQYINYEVFCPNSFNASQWAGYRFVNSSNGIAETLQASGALPASSTGQFLGIGSGTSQSVRWGDYTTTVFDPTLVGLGIETGGMWSLNMHSTGGTNQTSHWTALTDPKLTGDNQ